MSAQQYSVTVQCDYCDEVVSQSGKQSRRCKCRQAAQQDA